MTEIDKQIRQEIFFEKYKYVSVSDFEDVLKKLNESTMAMLMSVDLSTVNKNRLNAILKQIEEEQLLAFKVAEDASLAELLLVSKSFLASEGKLLSQKFDSRLIDQAFNPKNDLIFGYHFTELFKTSGQAATVRTRKIIAENLLAGKNPSSFSKVLYEQQVSLTKKQILTSVRTYAKTIRENIKNETEKTLTGQKGWMSLATLDSRTSAVCISLDREFYPTTKYETRNDVPNKPPRHFNCRSSLVRITEDTMSYTRAARGDEGGKQVDTRTTFDSFLKRNPDTAEQLLGPKKYDLYKSGKYSIKDFIADDGRFLTLKELDKAFN